MSTEDMYHDLLPLVGGHDGNDHMSSVEFYDPATNMWSAVAPMSTKRSWVAVIEANRFLYAGGMGRECPRGENEAHYGPDHFQVAITLTNLGNAHRALGDASKRRDLLDCVLRIFARLNESHYVPEHF